jgi:hypothetical protein
VHLVDSVARATASSTKCTVSVPFVDSVAPASVLSTKCTAKIDASLTQRR